MPLSFQKKVLLKITFWEPMPSTHERTPASRPNINKLLAWTYPGCLKGQPPFVLASALLYSGVLTLPCSRSLEQREPPSHQQRFQQLQQRDHQQQRRDAPHQDRARAGVPLWPQQLHVPGAPLAGEQDCPWGSRFQSTMWPSRHSSLEHVTVGLVR